MTRDDDRKRVVSQSTADSSGRIRFAQMDREQAICAYAPERNAVLRAQDSLLERQTTIQLRKAEREPDPLTV
jgi:hypothetical protein